MLVVEKKRKPKIRKIPSYLVYEEMNGKPLPYKGYLDVLSGKKKFEEIMESSSLQSIIVYIIGLFIGNNINRKKYHIASNEAGLHIRHGENLANDIAIYTKANTILDDKYFTTSPKIVIEIDIKIDLSETDGAASRWTNEWDYVIEKSNKMLDFGTEKVIWITTKSKKIFVSSSTERWYMVDFNEDIPLFDNVCLNLAKILQDEDIEF
jgi:Uma2 family endonuclease